MGKSTSATNIALEITGLLIDPNSQSHATLVTTGHDDFESTNSLYTVLMAERQAVAQELVKIIVPSQWDENLHILPARSKCLANTLGWTKIHNYRVLLAIITQWNRTVYYSLTIECKLGDVLVCAIGTIYLNVIGCFTKAVMNAIATPRRRNAGGQS